MANELKLMARDEGFFWSLIRKEIARLNAERDFVWLSLSDGCI